MVKYSFKILSLIVIGCLSTGAEAKPARFSKIGLEKTVHKSLTVSRSEVRTAQEPTSFGILGLGQTATYNVVIRNDNNAVNAFTDLLKITGASEFTIVTDTCSNIMIPPRGTCNYRVKFSPTVEGTFLAQLTLPSTWSDSSGTSTSLYVDDFIGKAAEYLPPPKVQACKHASIIRIDGQSLGEVIPVTGTGIELYYSSEQALQYRSPNKPGRVSFYNPEGWTYSLVNYLAGDRMFKGDGTSVTVKAAYRESLKMVVSPSGTEVYLFDNNGAHVETRTILTGALKYRMTYADGYLATISDAFNNQTEFIRDANGKLTGIISPYGQVTQVETASNGFISSVTNPNSQKYRIFYQTGTELMSRFETPSGTYSEFTYDSAGRLQKDTSSGGNEWLLQGTTLSQKQKYTQKTKMGRSTVTETFVDYSQDTYVREEIEPSGKETGYWESDVSTGTYVGYNSIEYLLGDDGRFGSLLPRRIRAVETRYDWEKDRERTKLNYFTQNISGLNSNNPFDFVYITNAFTDGYSVLSQSTYTKENKQMVNQNASGATSTITLDEYERVEKSQHGEDVPVTYLYDERGRLQSASQGSITQMSVQYDGNGNVSKITNAKGEETSFIRDLVGRITSQIQPDGGVVSFTYDANGNITRIIPPGKKPHAFSLNSMELLGEYTPPGIDGGVSATRFTYNLDKQITSVSKPSGSRIDYEYGTLDGLLKKVSAGGTFTTFTYNEDGRLRKETTNNGFSNEYAYYGPDLLSKTTRSTNGVVGSIKNTFNSNFLVNEVATTFNGVTNRSSMSYYADYRPFYVGQLLITYSNPSGRITKTTIGNIVEEYSFDSFGRLATYLAKYGQAGNFTNLYNYQFERDLVGRISKKTENVLGVSSVFDYSYDILGRLVEIKINDSVDSSYVYDSNGNRISGITNGKPFTAKYDDQDRLVSMGSTAYSYSRDGNLASVTYSTGAQKSFRYNSMGFLRGVVGINSSAIDYSLDHYGNRIYKNINGSRVQASLYHDALRIAASGTSTGDTFYVHGTGPNTPEYLVKNNQTYRLIKDHLGSPRLVINVDTGEIVQKLEYATFGKVISDSNPGFQDYGFAGGIYDKDTGLVRFGARDYDPETGRWTAKDPIGFNGGDTNLFGYVAQDPVNWVDPSGLATHFICRDLNGAGGAIGAKHCYLRITPEPGSSLGNSPITLSLLTPDGKIGNKYINAAVDSGPGSFSTSIDNGKCNTPSGQDKIDRAIMDSFNSQANGTPYSPIPNGNASNSNAFIRRVLEGTGLTVIPNAPFGAVGY